MNFNPGQLPTYESLFPVLRTQTTCIHRFTNLLQYFEAIITMDECPVVKPEPDAYLMVASRMGISPSNCIVIEDSPRGLKAAVAANMRCILIRTQLTDLDLCKGATWIVESGREIEGILKKYFL
jgi:beta-phosphoglucomutase-like phosphatase (HAD superfamily)